jgi:membrane peptidoglycan carboxypeptidase
VVDEPLRIGDWTPENYDRQYRGAVTLVDALVHSINTVAVRVSERAGQDRVRAMAARMGLIEPLAPGPAIALGTSEATLIDITGVYATIANRGHVATPRGIREISLRGENSALLRESPAQGEAAMSEANAGRLTWMLREVVERGTGRRAKLPDRDAAGKTGTTQAARDAWFIGFTADFVVGVWMGNDDNSPLTGVAGGGLPAEIWRETVIRLSDGLPSSPLPAVAPSNESILLSGHSGSSGGGTVVERVFLDVLRGLTGGGGGGGNSGDFKPKAGADR